MKLIYYCDRCEKEYDKEIEMTSEVFHFVCEKCGSEDVWVRDIIHNEKMPEVKLGNGGSLHS